MSELSREYISHFNQQAAQYLLCRPDYPSELFDFLAQKVSATALNLYSAKLKLYVELIFIGEIICQ